MKIEEGLYKVDAVHGVNAYVIETDDGLMIVDTGTPGSAKKIAAFIEQMGKRPSDVKRIVLTHSDIDHIGGAAELRALTGARLAIAEEDAAVLRGAPSPKTTRSWLGRMLMRVMKVRPAEPDEYLRDGDDVAGFRVLCVPGHTPGSVALVRQDGVVISGDTLLGGRGGKPAPPIGRLSDDIAQAMEGYARILALEPRLVLPGHGRPVRLD